VALDIGDWARAGARREEIVEEIGALRLVDGARETLAALKDAGARLAVISGTLDVCLDVLFPDHPFDEVFTNRIRFGEDGSIAGWEATPFDMEGKAHALEAIAARENIPLARTAFVGDHLNDVAAARRAGFAVAFNPKSDELARAAHLVVHDDDLRALLPHLMEPDSGMPARGRTNPRQEASRESREESERRHDDRAGGKGGRGSAPCARAGQLHRHAARPSGRDPPPRRGPSARDRASAASSREREGVPARI
jgi:HAD superfamily phosphoserine phosphatase-like hydrolase